MNSRQQSQPQTQSNTPQKDRLIFHPARIKRLIDSYTVNSHISKKINELDEKSGIKQYQQAREALKTGHSKRGADGKVIKEVDANGKKKIVKFDLTEEQRAEYQAIVDNAPKDIQSKLDEYLAYSKAKYRVSDGATHSLAYICEQIAHDLLNHAIHYCYDKEGKKQVTPAHFFKGDYEKLLTFPFLRNLPTWINSLSKMKEDPDLKSLMPKRKNAQKKKESKPESSDDSKPEEGKESKTTEPTSDSKPDDKAEPELDDKGKPIKKPKKPSAPKIPLQERLFVSSLNTIIKNITKPPKYDEDGKLQGRIVVIKPDGTTKEEIERAFTCKYSVVRVTEQAKMIVNSLLYEFLGGISNQIVLNLSYDHTKTVSDTLVKKLVESMVVFDHHYSEKYFETLVLANPEYKKVKGKDGKETKVLTNPDSEKKLVVDREYTFKSHNYTHSHSIVDDIERMRKNKPLKAHIILGMPIAEAMVNARHVSYEEYLAERQAVKDLSASTKAQKTPADKKKQPLTKTVGLKKRSTVDVSSKKKKAVPKVTKSKATTAKPTKAPKTVASKLVKAAKVTKKK